MIDFIETEVIINNSNSKKVKNNTHFVDYPYTLETTKVFLNEKWQNVSVIKEEQFLNGTKIIGPLLIIENNQTISQPYVVARMTELLDVKSNHKVLEIGTGSGYQCAVLSILARRVYTIERIKNLHEGSNNIFEKL